MRDKLGLVLDEETDFGELMARYADAVWIEEREIDRMAAAIGKAFEGDKSSSMPRVPRVPKAHR